MNHIEQDWSERLLHVGTDPDEEPVVELNAGGENSADAGASADGDAASEEVRQVGETSELDGACVIEYVYIIDTREILTFISRVHR